jgi:galactokinase
MAEGGETVIKHIKLPEKELVVAARDQLAKKGIEPSAENLLRENRKKGAPLYEYFKSINDKDWIEYAQYQVARQIIHTMKDVFHVGGKTITTRAVEVVRENGEEKYVWMRNILSDPNLRDSYMQEISSLMKQAQDKMDRLRELMRPELKEVA